MGGITHLVEHMALFPIGKRPYEYNGRVEDTLTDLLPPARPTR